jgi:hypothetical protein
MNYLIGATIALASAFVGMFLPMVSAVGPIQRPTNLLLGFVYGFGWFVAGFVRDVRSANVETFGSLVWPFAILLLATYLLGRQLSERPDRRLAIILGSLFLSLLIMPGNWVATTPLKYIPTYASILLAVY